MEMSDAIWLVVGLAFMGVVAAFFLVGFRDPHGHDKRYAEVESKATESSGWTVSSGTRHGSDGSSGSGGGGGGDRGAS
jgi:hypothetical protein